MPTDYSARTLSQKLGLKAGIRMAVLAPPSEYWDWLAPLPENINVLTPADGDLSCIHLFVMRQAVLEQELPGLMACIAPTGMIWVSWPKRAANIPTDVSETSVR